MIISGTPKQEIQVKVKTFAHAAMDISERGAGRRHIQKNIRAIGLKNGQENNGKYEQRVTCSKSRCGSSLLTSSRKNECEKTVDF